MSTWTYGTEITHMHARDRAYQINSVLTNSTSGRPMERTIQFMVEVPLRTNARPTLIVGHEACAARLHQAKRYGLHKCDILIHEFDQCINDPRRVNEREADIQAQVDHMEGGRLGDVEGGPDVDDPSGLLPDPVDWDDVEGLDVEPGMANAQTQAPSIPVGPGWNA